MNKELELALTKEAVTKQAEELETLRAENKNLRAFAEKLKAERDRRHETAVFWMKRGLKADGLLSEIITRTRFSQIFWPRELLRKMEKFLAE